MPDGALAELLSVDRVVLGGTAGGWEDAYARGLVARFGAGT